MLIVDGVLYLSSVCASKKWFASFYCCTAPAHCKQANSMVFKCRVKAGTATWRVCISEDKHTWGNLQEAVAKAMQVDDEILQISLNKKVHDRMRLRLLETCCFNTGCDCCRTQHRPWAAWLVQWRYTVGSQRISQPTCAPHHVITTPRHDTRRPRP